MKKIKAIFLDRDDTILIDKNYMYKIEDIDFFDDVFESFKILQNHDYSLFLVTNQSGIGRGYFNEDQMHQFHKVMQEKIMEQNLLPLKDIAFCPDHPDNPTKYRKPNPQMILDLIQKWNIDQEQSWMVGNAISDVLAGQNAGIKSALIRNKDKEYLSFKNLIDFTRYIIELKKL